MWKQYPSPETISWMRSPYYIIRRLTKDIEAKWIQTKKKFKQNSQGDFIGLLQILSKNDVYDAAENTRNYIYYLSLNNAGIADMQYKAI